MTISGINGANTPAGQMGMKPAEDSYSRNIQKQISDAQKQLQELSVNENMTSEEKMKKRQEIQQQINDLNMQLRQHQAQQRRAAMDSSKKQQAKASSVDDMPGGTKSGKKGSKGSGLSQAGMTAMISAESSMEQAKIQGSVATKMEGRAGVLESEIKLDKARGNSTQAKEEQLASAKQAAMKASESQMNTLGEASKALEEAAEEDAKDINAKRNDTEGKDTEGKDIEGKDIEGKDVKGKDIKGNDIEGKDTKGKDIKRKHIKGKGTEEKVHDTIDIRL